MTNAVSRPDVAAPTVNALLDELERLLEGEKLALRTLDQEALLGHAERKLALCERIGAAQAELDENHRARLARVRQAALHNQLVLVHARDTVRQVLSLASGRPPGASLGGLKVDLRG